MSRAKTYGSSAELAKASTGVVVVTVSEKPTTTALREGPLAGAALTSTQVTVSQALAGALPPTFVVDQLGVPGEERVYGRAYLEPGRTYLLYLMPSDLRPGSGAFVVHADGEYELQADSFVNVTEHVDRIPDKIAPTDLTSLLTS